MRNLTRLGAGVLALSMALGVAACGDDSDDDATDADTEETTTTEAPAEPITVTAVDYGFEGLPETVEAGSQLELVNSSAVEAHELVALLIPATETRPLSELLQLPEEQLFGEVFGGEPQPTTVLMVAPSSNEQITAVGDGTISEPGRYAVVCAFPVGGDPEVLLNPEAEGPPDTGDAEPHFARGMFAELTVT